LHDEKTRTEPKQKHHASHGSQTSSSILERRLKTATAAGGATLSSLAKELSELLVQISPKFIQVGGALWGAGGAALLLWAGRLLPIVRRVVACACWIIAIITAAPTPIVQIERAKHALEGGLESGHGEP
jgi:hypothetical protein